MAPSLLRPQRQFKPAEALQLAQQAPVILGSNPKAPSTSPLRFLFSTPETPDLWIIYENLLLACLRTGDDTSAHQCLERLVLRFGDGNERIMALKGLVKEACASNGGALEEVLKEYEAILGDNPSNIPIAKRRVAVLKSLQRMPDATAALLSLLDFSPTDAEGWSELAELYLAQGLYAQAIYALEEVLVLTPNAWNVHARAGELQFMAAGVNSSEDMAQQHLAESLKRFCRSIELCDAYLRGYYGLKTVSDKVLQEPIKSTKRSDADAVTLPDRGTVEKLNQLATEKLAEIVRRYSAGEKSWQGYDEGEIAAAKELLEQSAAAVSR